MVVALGPILFGLDQATLNGSIVIQTFRERFGGKDAATGAYIINADQQTALLAVFLAGAIIASVASGPIGTSLGRKAGFYFCITTSILGAVIQIVANSFGVVIFGRIVSGAGLGFAANFCNVYWSEVAPAHWRGVIMLVEYLRAHLHRSSNNLLTQYDVPRLHQCCCICWSLHCPRSTQPQQQLGVEGDSDGHDDCAVAIGMLHAVASGESEYVVVYLYRRVARADFSVLPGWYITRGRRDDARKALGQLRGTTWPEAELDAEIDDIVAMFELERQMEGSKTYADCFKKTDLRRTMVVFAVAAGQTFTGYSFIAG